MQESFKWSPRGRRIKSYSATSTADSWVCADAAAVRFRPPGAVRVGTVDHVIVRVGNVAIGVARALAVAAAQALDRLVLHVCSVQLSVQIVRPFALVRQLYQPVYVRLKHELLQL
jgi:hypothetical protein